MVTLLVLDNPAKNFASFSRYLALTEMTEFGSAVGKICWYSGNFPSISLAIRRPYVNGVRGDEAGKTFVGLQYRCPSQDTRSAVGILGNRFEHLTRSFFRENKLVVPRLYRVTGNRWKVLFRIVCGRTGNLQQNVTVRCRRPVGRNEDPGKLRPYPSGIAEIRNLEVVPRVEHKHPTPRRLKGRELVPGLPLSPIPACRELTSLPLR